jgi:Holliday junction resolvasome RuvABC ATP-dependent DNA helicase subunit
MEKARDMFINLLENLKEKDIIFVFSFKHFREPHVWQR